MPAARPPIDLLLSRALRLVFEALPAEQLAARKSAAFDGKARRQRKAAR